MTERRRRPAPGTTTPQAPTPRTSDAAVSRATGRARAEWFALLDGWGAATRAHREIAAWLTGEHDVPGWWAQTITVDYEQARGLRQPAQRRGGGFEAGVTRTIGVQVEQLFSALLEAEVRARWAPDAELRARTSVPNRSARFDWQDGSTRVIVGFTDLGDGRSQVSLTHERLADQAAVEWARGYWRARLDALKQLLEGEGPGRAAR